MIDEFWRIYSQTVFAFQYNQLIRDKLVKRIQTISVFSYIITTISLAGWSLTRDFAVYWSIIILASQIANGLKDLFHWNKKIWLLEMYLLDMDEVIVDFSKGWHQIMLSNLTEDNIRQRIDAGNKKYRRLERRYILTYHTGENLSAVKIADEKTNNQLASLHGKGEISNAQYSETIHA